MYRLITTDLRAHYPQTLDQHFRLRHDVFVKESGWTQFDVDGVRENDPYDTEDTIYVIGFGSREDVMGGFRLFPTTQPHMMGEAFAHLVNGPVVSRPDVMEISRYHIARAYRSEKTFYLESLAAMQEVGLELGLSAYACVTRTLRLPMFAQAGVLAEPLGMPALVDGVSTSAVLIHVEEKALANVNRARGSSLSVLEHNQLRRRRA